MQSVYAFSIFLEVEDMMLLSYYYSVIAATNKHNIFVMGSIRLCIIQSIKNAILAVFPFFERITFLIIQKEKI